MTDEQKHPGGRPPHEPTDQNRKLIKTLVGYGVPQADVAKIVGITVNTLKKHYEDELAVAVASANSKVAESLFKKATGDGPQSVSAAIFWMKVRAGWRDVNTHDHTSSDGSMTPAPTEIVIRAAEPDDESGD